MTRAPPVSIYPHFELKKRGRCTEQRPLFEIFLLVKGKGHMKSPPNREHEEKPIGMSSKKIY